MEAREGEVLREAMRKEMMLSDAKLEASNVSEVCFGDCACACVCVVFAYSLLPCSMHMACTRR